MSAIEHFSRVDLKNVRASFSRDKQHRRSLLIPFKGGRSGRTLCVIGQNPSTANKYYADKTIRFLEEYIYKKCPRYSQLLIVNVYSRVDTEKLATCDLIDKAGNTLLHRALRNHTDFLVILGQLKDERFYRFRTQAIAISSLLRAKHVYKFDLATSYSPHPGNSGILYYNFDVALARYDFSDLED